VVDLASLRTMGVGNLRVVVEFQSSRSQPLAELRFSKDGSSLAVIPRDGHLIKVFQLRPAPVVVGERPLRLMITPPRNRVQVWSKVGPCGTCMNWAVAGICGG
jgi:hypothetical protein